MHIVSLALPLLVWSGVARGDPAPAPVPAHDVLLDTPEACSGRCTRLLARSLQKINYSIGFVETQFKANNKLSKLGDVCWKFYDYNDCERQCGKRFKSEGPDRLRLLSRLVTKRCKFVDESDSKNIQCIHRYHSFLEIRCSAYLTEAVQLRRNATEGSQRTRDEETCRFLHYHNMCLSNTVFFYCPTAKKLFNRFTFRDYFLSFIVPAEDHLFEDEFLDYCQVFDFQKMAKDVYDTTSSLRFENFLDGSSEEATTLPAIELLGKGSREHPKKLFASSEELQETPPNFFYSSARFETTTQRAVVNAKAAISLKPQHALSPKKTSATLWSPEPVAIEFVSHVLEPAPTPASPRYTLDPNEILSTIFRIPKVFPTAVGPDPSTEAVESVTLGDEVGLEAFDSFDDEKDAKDIRNNEVVWKSKTPIPSSRASEISRTTASGEMVNVVSVAVPHPPTPSPEQSEMDAAIRWKMAHGQDRNLFLNSENDDDESDSSEETTAPWPQETQVTAPTDNHKSVKVTPMSSTTPSVEVERLDKGSVHLMPSVLDDGSSEAVTLEPHSREKLQETVSSRPRILENPYSLTAVVTSSEEDSDSDESTETSPPTLMPTTTATPTSPPAIVSTLTTVLPVSVPRRLPQTTKPTRNPSEPFLSGAKVHVKRIRHFSEKSDESAEKRENGNSADAIYFSHRQAEQDFYSSDLELNDTALLNISNPWLPRASGGRPSPSPRSVIDAVISFFGGASDEGESEVSRNDSSSLEPEGPPTHPETMHTGVQWFLVLYALLFLVAVCVLSYLVMMAILRQCRRRKKRSSLSS